MKRNLFTTIEKFLTNQDLYTFILSGAPFVGKTYLCMDLFKSYAIDYLYIDVRCDSNFNKYINTNKNEQIELKKLLSEYFNLPVDTLVKVPIILDEITENENLYKAIISYAKNQIEDLKLFIILSKHKKEVIKAFNNKHFESATLNPFSFDEFLIATGHEWYRDLIEGHFSNHKKLPEMLHNEIMSLFDVYMNVGGMPSAILEYLNYESMINVNNINNNLFTLTKARYNDTKIINILNAINECLKTKSKKFTFTKIHKGATIQQYQKEIDILIEDNIIIKSSKLNFTNSNYEEDSKSFRIYFKNFSYIPIEDEKSNECRIFTCIASALSSDDIMPYYSETKGGSLVDFISFCKKNTLVPFFLKTSISSREKAVEAFQSVYNTKYTYTVYDGNFDSCRISDFIPFYAMFSLGTKSS